ncbi:RNase H domain-containing protein [Trichonephila clavipes]|nr:RNase H domain-containing protein [Trichonephila clavipes]
MSLFEVGRRRGDSLKRIDSYLMLIKLTSIESESKDGAAQHTINSAALTYSELHSTYINNKQSTVQPAHHWYEAKRPGCYLFLQCSRQEQTILTRFRSGHLRTLTFSYGNKVFPYCVRCSGTRHLQNAFLTV